MSLQNHPLIVGLAAPGLLWLATSVATGQDSPPPLPGPSPSAPASPGTYRALLLSNGKVVFGAIVDDPAANVYRLRQSGGPIAYPKSMVLKAASSIDELYRFQAARLPAGDTEERMKLARWCLTEHLEAQAQEQLRAIQAIVPGDPEVERMLYSLVANARPTPPADGEVRQAGFETPRTQAAPAALDPMVIRKARNRFNALPEIFDLPQAQAVKRANEFADFVQPVIQQNCVRCHNEKYPGTFQLVEIKPRRDRSNTDIARANLDATLRLINPDDPARSELLSAGLVPHGGSKSAIFRGPNDPSYQVLAAWSKSLRTPRAGATPKSAGDGVARTGYQAPDAAPGEGFGSERTGRSTAPSYQPSGFPMPGLPPGGLPPSAGFDYSRQATAAAAMGAPARAMVEQIDESAEFVNAPGDRPQFPTPYSVGGAPPKRPTPAPGPVKGRPVTVPNPTPADPDGPASSTPPVVAKTATQVGRDTVVVETTDDPNDLPGMNLPRYPTKADADPSKSPPRRSTTPCSTR